MKELRTIHRVKCKYCGKIFDRDKIGCVKVSGNRYAHITCSQLAEQNKTKEEKDKEELENYIKQLFNITSITPKIKKQMALYTEQYKYTYSGMQKALKYFYEIKGNDISKANEGIGIIPYTYKQAFDYYYSLWVAKSKNEDKDIQNYIPQERIVKIPVPQRKTQKRKIFTFLDDEVQNNGK